MLDIVEGCEKPNKYTVGNWIQYSENLTMIKSHALASYQTRCHLTYGLCEQR